MHAFLSAAFVLVFSTGALAQTTYDYSIHQDYISPRSMGAGGTFSVIDDYNVLFYNPAGLARLKEGQLNMGIQVGLAPSIQSLLKDIETTSKSSSTSDMLNLLNRHYGDHYGMRFPTLGAIWARPGWGIGIIPVDLSMNLEFHQQVGPQLNVTAYQDSTIAYGYAQNFMEDKLSVGATVKGVYRAFVGKDLLAADLVTNSNPFQPSDAKEGLTVDLDLGTIYTPTIPEEGFFSNLKHAKPTFSLVVHNLLDYGFKQNLKLYNKTGTAGNEPVKLQRRVDIGSKWELPNFWVFTPKFMFDVRDMGHRYWAFMKGLHTGFELQWDAFSWLRGYYSLGLSQGYYTLGVGAQLVWFRLDLTTYGEEVGTSEAKKENRILMAKMSLDF